jgi:hypothetical protein
MKWLGRLLASIGAVVLASSGGSASTMPDEDAWAQAVKSDSLEAYAAFVMKYPDSEHAQTAYERLSGGASATSDAKVLFLEDEAVASEQGLTDLSSAWRAMRFV